MNSNIRPEKNLGHKLPDNTIIFQPFPRPWLAGFVFAGFMGGSKYVLDLYRGQPFSWPVFFFLAGFWTVVGALFGLLYSTQNICLDQSGIMTGSGPGKSKTLWKDVNSYELSREAKSGTPFWKKFGRNSKPLLKFYDRHGKEINRVVLSGATPEQIEAAIEYVEQMLGEPVPKPVAASEVTKRTIVLRSPLAHWKYIGTLALVYPAAALILDWFHRQPLEWGKLLENTGLIGILWGWIFYYFGTIQLDYRAIKVWYLLRHFRWSEIETYRLICGSQARASPRLEFFGENGVRLGSVTLNLGTPQEKEEAIEYVRLVLGEPKE